MHYYMDIVPYEKISKEAQQSKDVPGHMGTIGLLIMRRETCPFCR